MPRNSTQGEKTTSEQLDNTTKCSHCWCKVKDNEAHRYKCGNCDRRIHITCYTIMLQRYKIQDGLISSN